jgi:hypothetical protein
LWQRDTGGFSETIQATDLAIVPHVDNDDAATVVDGDC